MSYIYCIHFRLYTRIQQEIGSGATLFLFGLICGLKPLRGSQACMYRDCHMYIIILNIIHTSYTGWAQKQFDLN